MRCSAMVAGEPCNAPEGLVDETGLCQSHRDPEGMRERGRKGGEATREALARPGLTSEELGSLETIEDAQRWLRLIGEGVVTKRLDRGDASAAVKAIEAWLKADDSLTDADMERIAKKLAEVQGGKPKLRKMSA